MNFGHVSKIDLNLLIENQNFKSLFYLKKDEILVCKYCEFRYVCLDCRAYTVDPKIFSLSHLNVNIIHMKVRGNNLIYSLFLLLFLSHILLISCKQSQKSLCEIAKEATELDQKYRQDSRYNPLGFLMDSLKKTNIKYKDSYWHIATKIYEANPHRKFFYTPSSKQIADSLRILQSEIDSLNICKYMALLKDKDRIDVDTSVCFRESIGMIFAHPPSEKMKSEVILFVNEHKDRFPKGTYNYLQMIFERWKVFK